MLATDQPQSTIVTKSVNFMFIICITSIMRSKLVDTSSRLSSAVDPAANESTHNNIPPQSKDEHSVREGSDPPSDISTDPNRSEDMADDETPPAFFQV